jgi:hypothetical protein
MPQQQFVRFPSTPPLTRMTSARCDRDVWTGTFAHECSVNQSFVFEARRVRSAMCGGSIIVDMLPQYIQNN